MNEEEPVKYILEIGRDPTGSRQLATHRRPLLFQVPNRASSTHGQSMDAKPPLANCKEEGLATPRVVRHHQVRTESLCRGSKHVLGEAASCNAGAVESETGWKNDISYNGRSLRVDQILNQKGGWTCVWTQLC